MMGLYDLYVQVGTHAQYCGIPMDSPTYHHAQCLDEDHWLVHEIFQSDVNAEYDRLEYIRLQVGSASVVLWGSSGQSTYLTQNCGLGWSVGSKTISWYTWDCNGQSHPSYMYVVQDDRWF